MEQLAMGDLVEVRGAKDALWYGIVMEAPVQSEWMDKSKKKNCAKLVSGAIVQWLDYPSRKTNHNTFILTKTRAFIPFQAILRWGTGIGTLNLGSGKFDYMGLYHTFYFYLQQHRLQRYITKIYFYLQQHYTPEVKIILPPAQRILGK